MYKNLIFQDHIDLINNLIRTRELPIAAISIFFYAKWIFFLLIDFNWSNQVPVRRNLASWVSEWFTKKCMEAL
jgi:hypothetical protein